MKLEVGKTYEAINGDKYKIRSQYRNVFFGTTAFGFTARFFENGEHLVMVDLTPYVGNFRWFLFVEVPKPWWRFW